MVKAICSFMLLAIVFYLPAQKCVAQKKDNHVQKEQERYTVSLDLEFSRKSGSAMEGTLSLLFSGNPNAYATGFLVGDRLVMTAYHVVSGNLSAAKKINLGFKPGDELAVRVYINGCRATVIKVDKDADLALLEICGSPKSKALTFQPSLSKNEKLFLIARPHGNKMVSRGVFYGPYILRGQEYWSAKIDSRDGYSGSPVYNQRAEIVGVFTGYDWVQDVALISPAAKAQKLIEEYTASLKP